MSENFINVRFLFWHLQAKRGSLWAWSLSFNEWWLSPRVMLSPFAIYDFNLKDGWNHRKDGVPVAVTNQDL